MAYDYGASAPDTGPAGRTRFEYRHTHTDECGLDAKLNELDAQGWDIVSVSGHGNYPILVVFRRALPARRPGTR